MNTQPPMNFDRRAPEHAELTYPQIDRRAPIPLEAAHVSDDLIEEIAERAATKAVKKMTDEAYIAIGKSITEKFFYIAGVLCVAGYLWAQSKGLIK